MADLKISALNSLAGADLVAADVVAVVDDSASETKKLTVSDLIANGTTLISDATIPSAKILFAAGAIDTAELAASAVETAKINDSAVTAAKLADNSSVTLVSTLPASGDFTGQIALDTDDDKIYVWDGSAWDSVKGAGSINVVSGSTSGIVNITTSTSGDTVTVSTTLDDTTAAKQFLAGPTGAGGTVGYRAIASGDLPTATSSAKGAVAVNGNGLTMSNDEIQIDNSVTAETTEHHLVQYDANGLITAGRVIAGSDLPEATSSAKGAVVPGSGLSVASGGTLNHTNSTTAGTFTKVTVDAQGHVTGAVTLAAADIPDLDAAKITTGTFATARLADEAVTAAKLADQSVAKFGGAGATDNVVTFPDGDFKGQFFFDEKNEDLYIYTGESFLPITVISGNLVNAGTYDASTNLLSSVTTAGSAAGFTNGAALPAPAPGNLNYYVVVDTSGTGSGNAPSVALAPPDMLISLGVAGTTFQLIDVSNAIAGQTAANISVVATGNIAATDVQAALQELDTEKLALAGGTMTGNLELGDGVVIVFEGATDDGFETTLTVADPTADRTITLPNETGTVVTTGSSGVVTSTMITDGTIVNADISASAEIAVSKLANGTARQLLQTDVAGTGVEFTSNVDVPGTLDVTGAATFDSTAAVAGALTVTGVINADGKVKFPAGSASAPSFYFGTDTNTGLYHPAADAVAITTGGTQRVVVNSSGQVGIGTASPTQPLTVNGVARFENFIEFGGSISTPATAASIYRPADNTLAFGIASVERLRINSSGNVGIGTSAPGRNLVVNGGSSEGVLQITNNTSGTSVANGLEILCFTTGEAQFLNRENADMRFDTNNTERVRISSSGDVNVGPINISSSTGYGAQVDMAANAATIKAQCQGTASSFTLLYEAYKGTSRNFYVNAAGAAYFQGSVGIGTSSTSSYNAAADNLVIYDSGNAGITIRSGTSSDGAIYFNDTDDANQRGIIRYVHANDALAFHTSAGESLRIDSSGNVLIGTTTAASNSQLTVRAASPQLALYATPGNDSRLNMGDTDDHDIGMIAYANSDNSMRFTTNASERMRIASDGVVIVKNSSVGEIDALTSASTITPDFAASNNFSVTLGTNATLANPSNLTAGQSGVIAITQDGTGSRTLAYGSKFKFAGGTAPTLTTTASAVDILTYYVESTSRITAQVLLNVS